MERQNQEETKFEDPEEEERIINLEKIYEFFFLYRIPLVFGLIGVLFLGGGILFWQLTNKSDKVIFTQEEIPSNLKIKVDIEGAVIRPGVYEIDLSSRIHDLLILAGGLSKEADREWVSKNLNLAAKLTDGGKVYIPARSQNPAIKGQSLSLSLISLNTASQSELESLPGIGPVTAKKIIENRPFQTIDELIDKKIIGRSTLEKIKDKITLY